MTAGEGVGGAIGGGARLAFRRARSGGVARVFAVGSSLFIRGHECGYLLLAIRVSTGEEGGGCQFSDRLLRELGKIYFGNG